MTSAGGVFATQAIPAALISVSLQRGQQNAIAFVKEKKQQKPRDRIDEIKV
jgi:hypothetical protein